MLESGTGKQGRKGIAMKNGMLALAFLVVCACAGRVCAQEGKAAPMPGQAMWDVGVAPALAKAATPEGLWGKGIPEKIVTATDVPGLLKIVAGKERRGDKGTRRRGEKEQTPNVQ